MPPVSKAFAIAVAHRRAGRNPLAEEICRRIVAAQPDHDPAWHLLGLIAVDRGAGPEAIEFFGRAASIRPGESAYQNSLGQALQAQGRLQAAAACYRRALGQHPKLVDACTNLGAVLRELGELDEAAAWHRRAIELNPNLPEPHNNLANTLKDQGLLGEAIACYRRALELGGAHPQIHANLIYALHFCPDADAATIREQTRAWSDTYATPLRSTIEPHARPTPGTRRLRVGYVSPDFRDHPVGRFLLPLLAHHDHRQFEVFCYSSTALPDAVTDRCRGHADVWRAVKRVSDAELTGLVRQDGIDILVDLAMHMAGCRLRLFARKPAPVQVTYLAYCGTTGLSAIDYRLTDPYLDPIGGDERIYAEQSVRLPDTYWCYQPPDEARPVNRLPANEAGCVTFGCLNNFCKISETALEAWCRLLGAVPQSRLLLHAPAGSARDRLGAFLARRGLAPDRLSCVALLPMADYLRLHHQIDVALDPFPYGGGTTTCDALWMGVPVVTLAGRTAVGRGGVSILSNVGLPELIARDPEEYVAIAAGLARDPARLAQLRAGLRARMQNSPLMDAPRFARNVEAAYRTMWRRWCGAERA